MSSGPVATFIDTLRNLQVDVTSTNPRDFSRVISDIVRPLAIGVPLGFDDVSLAETPITINPTVSELEEARTGVTRAGMGIASYGSLVIEATPTGTEEVSLFPEFHVAVVREDDIVAGMPEAFAHLGPKIRSDRGSAIIATGPSATADMGGLVYGAHGPSEVHVVLIEGDDQ